MSAKPASPSGAGSAAFGTDFTATSVVATGCMESIVVVANLPSST